jgi:hypothetical protein
VALSEGLWAYPAGVGIAGARHAERSRACSSEKPPLHAQRRAVCCVEIYFMHLRPQTRILTTSPLLQTCKVRETGLMQGERHQPLGVAQHKQEKGGISGGAMQDAIVDATLSRVYER